MINISYKGFNAQNVTFKSGNDLKIGVPINLDASGVCSVALEGVDFLGTCICHRNGLATVQLNGYIEFPYSGPSPNYGRVKLCADGNGGVRSTSEETITTYTVIYVDTNKKVVGFII